MKKISLQGVRMNVVQTAANGVVNDQTVFQFSQLNDFVYASYAGGRIVKGFLVGLLQNDKLQFSYCQVQDDGTIDNGKSECELQTQNGKIQLIEHFTWESRDNEKGTNIFQEL